ncbi:uncharacterized protein LOC122058969 [Macadamia integrifolia]|uniref:uncharacterized protein LOC122058969 n=1 Tax=Macadamia integrifolia TaxID=60698 RepID=UPI001C532A86|nr:uncharacterized protein LOC122058969 [Macadamia integrifolia]
MGTSKKYMGITGIFEAEVEGLMEGLLRAKAMNITCLWVEFDSSSVVLAIQQRKIPWYALQRWMHLNPFLDSISWKISHNFREGNSIADYLARDAAKTGISGDNAVLPSHILDLLQRDLDGRLPFQFY